MGKIDGVGIELPMSEFLFLEQFLSSLKDYKAKPESKNLEYFFRTTGERLTTLKEGIEAYGCRDKDILIRIVPD